MRLYFLAFVLVLSSVGLALHDPSISVGDVRTTPSAVVEQQLVKLTATVRNVGTETATNVFFDILLDNLTVGSFNCSSIPASWSCSRTTQYIEGIARGMHRADVRISSCDGGCGAVDNNNATLSFNVLRRQGDITGTVSDQFGNPIAGATVMELSTQSLAVTSVAGSYTITNINPGTVSVVASASPNFRAHTKSVAIYSDQLSQLSFTLVANNPPSIRATGLVNNTKIGKTLRADATGTADLDGDTVSYSWDWGDTTVSQTRIATHAYQQEGEYIITLTATDSPGLASTKQFNVNVTTNRAPSAVANVTYPAQIQPPLNDGQIPVSGVLKANQSFNFSGAASNDSDGLVVSYSWDFGDGLSGSGQNVSHFYSQPGEYTVTLTVADDDGDTSTNTVGVRAAQNQPPAGSILQLGECITGRQCSFLAQASDEDGRVASRLWQFGDTRIANSWLVSHTYSTAGTYQVVLTLTDDNFYSSTITQDVEAFTEPQGFNRPPVVEAGQNRTALAGEMLAFAATASDADGDSLLLIWSFGDGAVVTGTQANHSYSMPGTYLATLTASDGIDTTTDALTVTVSSLPQQPPLQPQQPQPPQQQNQTQQNNNTNQSQQDNTSQDQTPGQNVTPNIAPVAFAGSDVSALAGQQVTFTGSASDVDGTIVSYVWSFGDGTSATGQVAVHTYSNQGTYNSTLTVRDNGNALASDTVTVRVSQQETLNDTIQRIVVSPSLAMPGQRVTISITALTPSLNVTIGQQTTTLTDFNNDNQFSYDFITPADEGVYDVLVVPFEGNPQSAQFEVDGTPPGVLSSAPASTNLSQAELVVTTDENSECRLSAQDVAFDRMASFDSTGGRRHASSVRLEFDGDNKFYVLCEDAAGNVPASSFPVTVSLERGEAGPRATSVSGLASGSLADPLVGGAVVAGAAAISLAAMLLYRRHIL